MRSALAILLIAILLLPITRGQEDIRDPSYVNNIISINQTPQLTPNDKGEFHMTLLNPYPNAMHNVSLKMSIYLYVSWEEEIPVDANWSWDEPYFEEDGRGATSHIWTFDIFEPGLANQVNLTITVVTSKEAPHGGLLSQGSYFIRFELEFDYVHSDNTTEHALMRSRGYFSDDEWTIAKQEPKIPNDPNYVGDINLTYLGVKGILPETSFGVLEPFPIWAFYLLVGLAVLFVILAVAFYLQENPERLPFIANRLIRLRSAVRQSRRLSRKEKTSNRKKV